MLTTSALGMAFYGLYSVATGIADLVGGMQLEWWANLWLIVAGFILVLAAAFVRVSMLGGLALAVGGLLALQSISLHNAGHLYGNVALEAQLARATMAGLLVAFAYVGWESDPSQRTT